jgi:hypothetical protein
MAYFDWGNVPLKSTTVSVSDPSTATLIAEIDSTAFATVTTNRAGTAYRVNWRVGASTGAIFLLERCTSTGLGSSAIAESCMIFTGANQTAQYVDTYKIDPGQRMRVRVASSMTATVAAQISAEPLT